MKTLLLHGMGGYIREEHLAYARQRGLEVHYQSRQYIHQFYDELKEYVEAHQIVFLVGRSHEGFLCLLASRRTEPILLVDQPSVSIRSRKKISPQVSQTICPLCLVALGSEDQLVDPQRTKFYLEKDQREDRVTKIKMPEGVGHWLDLVFQELPDWALAEISNAFD